MTEKRVGTDGRTQRDTDHLQEIEDGCGCVEVWERLSEQRASE